MATLVRTNQIKRDAVFIAICSALIGGGFGAAILIVLS